MRQGCGGAEETGQSRFHPGEQGQEGGLCGLLDLRGLQGGLTPQGGLAASVSTFK